MLQIDTEETHEQCIISPEREREGGREGGRGYLVVGVSEST